MVLLFETKAGWNQHGGPELFTFDNHDPHGGLVVLNDGTVKFIRTEEELKQLRWNVRDISLLRVRTREGQPSFTHRPPDMRLDTLSGL